MVLGSADPKTEMKPKIWRLRYLVRGYLELPSSLRYKQTEIQVKKVALSQTQAALYYLDFNILHDDVREGFFSGCELAEELLDKLSYLSFAPISGAPASITVPAAKYGECFLIAIPQASFKRSRHEITQDDIDSLENLEIASTAALALRHFRNGMATTNPYESCRELWTSMEMIARERAKKENRTIIKKCPKCGEDIGSHPAEQGIIESIFCELKPDSFQSNGDAIKGAKETRNFRGGIVHGGRLDNKEQREKAYLKTSVLQSASAVALSKELGVLPVVGRCHNNSLGFFQANIKVDKNGKIELCGTQIFETGFALAYLPSGFYRNYGFNYKTGIFPPITVPPECLPDLS